jgi:hypothetical protein
LITRFLWVDRLPIARQHAAGIRRLSVNYHRDGLVDLAANVLTDWPVIQALTRAADRGITVRIYLDGTQLAEREPAKFTILQRRRTSIYASNATTAPLCTSRAMRLVVICPHLRLVDASIVAPVTVLDFDRKKQTFGR